jgi:filamentous hemagglutinin
MKLFLKVLFFIFTIMIITEGDVKSSTVVAILHEKTSYSFLQKQHLSTILFENHNANFCLNGENVVAYGERVINTNASVAKGGDELVWNYIKETQEVYPGSVLPKSFELTTTTNTIWVHPNATEHIAEFIKMKAVNYTPEAVQLATQQQLNSLRTAVSESIKNGVVYDKLLEVGGWELKFSQPRQVGQLPALIHAQPIK